MVLAIVVVNQSIMGWPPLQDKLSTRPSQFRPNLRQSRYPARAIHHKLFHRLNLLTIFEPVGVAISGLYWLADFGCVGAER